MDEIKYQIRKNWVVLMACGLAMLVCLGVLYNIGDAKQVAYANCKAEWEAYTKTSCVCETPFELAGELNWSIAKSVENA